MKDMTEFVPQDMTETIAEALRANELRGADSPETLRMLSDYGNELLRVSRFINLTAIKDPIGVAYKHFADSIAMEKYVPEGARIIDIGSGAGFPAVPLAAARPDLRVTALDGTLKRVNFMRGAIAYAKIPNCGAVCGRAEDFANDAAFRERYDAATARAVARLNILCELCLPFVKEGGVFIAMKSVLADEEIREAKKAIHVMGGKLRSTVRFHMNMNGEDAERTLIVIEKLLPTKSGYPRAYSIIRKQPL